MRTIFSILTLSFFCLIFQNRTFAQDENTGYAKVEYMKVKSGMWDKYVACEKAWKLVHEYRVRQGLITGWEFEQVLIPAGTNNEYDFLTVTLYKDWKSLYTETDWYTAAMKSLPADKREIAEKAEDYRDIVKTEIWSAGDLAGNPGAKFRVENFMRIPEGGWQKWIEMESKFVKPVHEKNIAAGNRAGWLLAFMDLPRVVQEVLWFNPLVHVIALMRAGIFPTYVPQYAAPLYPAVIGALTLALGMLFLRAWHKDIIARR